MFQSMMEDPYKVCPVCKGMVKRLISPGAGLIFKGSGFYITDYKKKETAVTGPVSKDKPKEDTSKGADSSPAKSSKDKKKKS
jgi:predicted nucleic acid-binding Zn ribbon protein